MRPNYPDEHASRYRDFLGLYVAASIGKERERCLAHVQAASLFGRPELCIPYILNGERMHPKHWERYALEAARLDCAEAARAIGYEKKVLPPPPPYAAV